MRVGEARVGEARGRECAGFWVRVVAHGVDLALIQAGVVGSLYVPGLAPIVAVFGGAVYFAGFTATPWQATPGKRVVRICVVREDGGRMGVGAGLGRYLAYFVSAACAGLGFLSVGVTREKVGLHDMLCGTRVVHGRWRGAGIV